MEREVISVGGLGGSGTRVIAEILIQLGVFMGDDLNKPYDNLVFTRLFKNPKWYRKSSLEEKEYRFLIFRKYMEGKKLSPRELLELYRAAGSNPTFKTKPLYYLKKLKLITRDKPYDEYWGWKEPNNQIYISEILEYFPDLKYIHVIRNGLDMAFTSNLQQLHNWGWKYDIGIEGDEDTTQMATKQLDYWVSSTRDVLSKIEQYEDRTLIVNHSKLCNQPIEEVDRIIDFVGIKAENELRRLLYSVPRNDGSYNRYKNHDLSIFSEENLNFVRKCGFEVLV